MNFCARCKKKWGRFGDYTIPFYEKDLKMVIKKICLKCFDCHEKYWDENNYQVSKLKTSEVSLSSSSQDSQS